MSKVAVITDSTSDMSSEFARAHNIHVVPLYILFGTDTLRDRVDIDPAGFFKRLREDPRHPQTSQPTPADFADAYRRAHEDGADEVCVFTISLALSGTYESAIKARAEVDFPVYVCDTRTASVALSLVVIAAAEAAAQGAGGEEVLEIGRAVAEKTQLFFVVDTLEYLHRGGRIGAASKFFGTMLSIKPILEVRDGLVQGKEKIRTRKRALARLVDLVGESIDPARPLIVGAGHGDARDELDWVVQQVVERFHPQALYHFEVGPTVGTHVGPGLLGVGFYQP
ncbi:MAG: DegV family protein [Anaerolineae bacterium]|nr:DegV family protein [Anaerolineae bacterium]